MLLEKGVKWVMKIDEKERSCKKILQEVSKMDGNLTTISHIDGFITHYNNLKTDEFYTVHEWVSVVRHVGEETHQFK